MTFRVLVLVLISLELSAQSFNAAPFFGMGNIGIAREGVYSLYTNPSGIANIKTVEIAMAYQQHFMLSDLSFQALYAAVPINKGLGTFGMHVRKYGVRDVSNLLTVNSSYARTFGDHIRTSITINFHQYAVIHYVNQKAFSGDLGLQYCFEKFLIGLYYRNISNAAFTKEIEQRIPQELGIGSTYLLSDHVQLSADFIRELPDQFDFRSGLEYRFDERFKTRGGISVKPVQYFAGIGMLINRFQVDLASSFHSRLGTSPQISLSYAF